MMQSQFIKIILFVALVFIYSKSPAAFGFQTHYQATSAEGCSEIDFRKTFPLKIRNQHEIGWCFAHAAADYLQYTYQIPEQISAADIAINYSKSSWSQLTNLLSHLFKKSTRNTPNQDGFLKFAVKEIIPQGYCPESILPSEEWMQVNTVSQEETKKEIILAGLDIFDLLKKVHKKRYRQASELPFYYKFNQINQDTFFHLLKRSNKKNIFEHIRQAACKGNRLPFPGPLSIHMHLKSRKTFKIMNNSFENNSPVTIDFYSKTLKDISKKINPFGSLHTVLLYGRNYDRQTKECQYLLKNSYGSSCLNYDPKLNCDSGYLWIPEHIIFKSMISQVIFNEKKQ